jgi:hypothetical protein
VLVADDEPVCAYAGIAATAVPSRMNRSRSSLAAIIGSPSNFDGPVISFSDIFVYTGFAKLVADVATLQAQPA